MNKKLLIGLSSIGMAAGFWACGSGSIEPMADDTDVFVEAMLNNLDFSTQINDAMSKCNEDIVCMNEMAKAAHGAVELSSESTLPESSADGQPIVSSSSESFFKFSSIGDVGRLSSSSDAGTVVSSSSEQVVITGIGRCYPLSETAELNSPVQWKVDWGAPWNDMSHIKDVATATYSWAFGLDATPDNNAIGTPKVSYSKSGPKSASVDVVIGGQKGHIDCDTTVNVNGAPITGCMCTTEATSVDFTATPDVVWTVTGCKSATTPLLYSWDGGAAGAEASFTKTFTAAQNGYAPTLKVSHSDNTIQPVTCPAVKTTAGPEYLFEIEGDQLNTTAKAIKNEGCMVVRGEWTNSGYQPTFSVLCDGKADDQNVGMTFTMTYAGKSVATATGTWGFSNAGAKIGQINVGKFNYEGICVTFTGASTVTCKVQ